MRKSFEALTLEVEKLLPTKREEEDVLCYWHQKEHERSLGLRMSEHEKRVNMYLYGKEVV
jgi:hypothetical protein